MDPDVFVALVEPHRPAMMRIAAVYLRPAHPEDVEDAVEEAVGLAWKSWHQVSDESKVPGWLAKITINVCLGWRRGRFGFWRRASVELPGLDEDHDERFATPPRGYGAECDTDDALTRYVVRAAVNGLKQNLRMVVILRYYVGLNSAEVGIALGIPDGTVRTRLRTALEHLRAPLGDALFADMEEEPCRTGATSGARR
jgi:RNA polymerase sigma-70 factor (ECF subfamily)